MSTKAITDSLITTVSKGPLVIFVLLGAGMWQASKMTEAQINTIEHLVSVLNNPVGSALYTVLMLILLYTLILWPTGKFLSGISKEFFDSQKLHAAASLEHHTASKAMFHEMQGMRKAVIEQKNTIDHFFAGKQ